MCLLGLRPFIVCYFLKFEDKFQQFYINKRTVSLLSLIYIYSFFLYLLLRSRIFLTCGFICYETKLLLDNLETLTRLLYRLKIPAYESQLVRISLRVKEIESVNIVCFSYPLEYVYNLPFIVLSEIFLYRPAVPTWLRKWLNMSSIAIQCSPVM